jgi:uncharacterized cupin superfamily protein
MADRQNPQAFSLPADSDAWAPFEAGVVNWLRQDEAVQSGVWRCKASEQPGIHEGEFEGNETVLILEGRVRVEIVGGPTFELGPGDSASFVAGTVGRWKVLEDVKEFFVYS